MESSIQSTPAILFASSGAVAVGIDNFFHTNEGFSLLGHVYSSKDFMNLFLFQDLLSVEDRVDLWPKTTRTMDWVLRRWA